MARTGPALLRWIGLPVSTAASVALLLLALTRPGVGSSLALPWVLLCLVFLVGAAATPLTGVVGYDSLLPMAACMTVFFVGALALLLGPTLSRATVRPDRRADGRSAAPAPDGPPRQDEHDDRRAAVSEPSSAPTLTGVHHFSPTVRDVEASAAWYGRVLGMTRVPVTFPHHGDEDGGFAVLMVEPRSGVMIGLHHHEANPGDGFDERRNGLDHVSFAVAQRTDLDTWTAWLDDQGVEHSGVRDVTSPMPFATVVFRDPDNIQLELIHMPA